AEKLVRSYDINICDSEYEKTIKRDSWWNIDEEKIFVTGYPRYDKLYNTEIEKKEILFMPTWRNWIRAEKGHIEDTEYFKNITGLITNEKLNGFLEKNEITLSLYIHQLMHDYLGNFGNIKLGKNVKLLPKEAEITKELMKSEILITDYSSVAYDFYYLNKPIIFFQFDKNEYTEKVGSYVDLDKDLFGAGVYTVNECVQKIMDISENGFKYDEETSEKSERLKEKFLKYTDKENCRRVFELILSKIGERNGER
ncbi:MAG: CDP-glycerol glycerophosphotransferase family protein, partial [Leptotrichiaceae bacterium]|nr:CDP-glycerol glycerophosphotransferase family protein [Leptotrichiaceae bacterium]